MATQKLASVRSREEASKGAPDEDLCAGAAATGRTSGRRALGADRLRVLVLPRQWRRATQCRISTRRSSLADGGPLDAAECEQVCNEFSTGVVTCVRESADSVLCITHPYPCEGRRPAGLRQALHRPGSGFECHLADAAWLEAASVDAFRVLRRELRAHRAPRRLLRAASRSARDERRHARVTAALARRFGVAVATVERDDFPLRSLEELARENAVEGCVRETWGALVALRQASRASEPAVRAAMGRIARDEIRHAELAWAVDGWIGARLTAAQRRRVRDARVAAVAELGSELQRALPRAERDRLGLPGSQEAAQMLTELDWLLGLTAARARWRHSRHACTIRP